MIAGLIIASLGLVTLATFLLGRVRVKLRTVVATPIYLTGFILSLPAIAALYIATVVEG